MKPSECRFSTKHGSASRCPITTEHGHFIMDTCPYSCPIVKLDLRCQENWAYADTVMRMVKVALAEIAALDKRVVQLYEQHDAELALLWKELDAIKKEE